MYPKDKTIPAEYLDAFKEIGNIGAGHAATALSQMIQLTVDLSIPKLIIFPLNSSSEFPMVNSQTVASLFFSMSGELNGTTLIFFPLNALSEFIQTFLKVSPENPQNLSELQKSALQEIGNILTGAYLRALSNFLNIKILHSVSQLKFDMEDALLESLITDLDYQESMGLLIESQLKIIQKSFNIKFYFIPNKDGLINLINKLDAVLKKNGHN
jgi:chemotaxis protein CheC